MKRKLAMGIMTVMLTAVLSGCDNNNQSDSSGTTGQNTSESYVTDSSSNGSSTGSADKTEISSQGNVQTRLIPQETATISEEYYSLADEQGTLVELNYDTYESFSYGKKSQPLNKRAIIYLPYGYNQNEQYNVFYLMHGGWGNETTTLRTPDNPSMFKNVIDHAIAAGEFEPLIIVCPTYNNTSPEDSSSFSLALQLNANLHNELLNDLLPAVEETYSTYAADTTPEGLMSSRNHRGFGGFSMGAVATWRTFQHGLDYFRYFLPMSCGTGLTDPEIYAAAKDRQDFFVWVITGTEDFAYPCDTRRVENMRELTGFAEGDTKDRGNFAYRVKEGYDHGGLASMEYTYNGLRWFWNGGGIGRKRS